MARSRMLGVFDGVASDVLRAFPYRCSVMRNRKASCTRCAQACTSGAISIDDEEVSVDGDLCVGCGTCETACPTCALEANNPNDAVLADTALAALAAAGNCGVVLCDQAWETHAAFVDPAKSVRVCCLGRVEESLCVSLVAAGAEEVVLVCGDCGSCPREAGRQTYEAVVETANLLLETWGSSARVTATRMLPRAALADEAGRPALSGSLPYDESRRRMLSQLGRAALDTVVQSAVPSGKTEEFVDEVGRVQAARFMKTMKDGTLPHFIPDRRERLLDALAQLGEPADVALETSLWGRVVVDASKCRTCYGCATFCPTGAIVKWKDGISEGIEHVPADCVKCRSCTDICPTGALSLCEDVMARDVACGGVVERWELPAVNDDRGRAHSIVNRMKKSLGMSQIYER